MARAGPTRGGTARPPASGGGTARPPASGGGTGRNAFSRGDTAQNIEHAVVRRVFRMTHALAVGVTALYGALFALGGPGWLAGLCMAGAALLGLAGWVAGHGDQARRGLSVLAWLLLVALGASTSMQGGLTGSSLWWIFTLPILLLQAHLARQALAMVAVIVLLVGGLWWAARSGQLPPPRLLPLGDAQRALSFAGALVLISLTSLRTHRWRKGLIDELQRTRAAADEAGQAREQFIANISHEIRTPLNGVAGAAELLHLSALDAGQRRAVDVLRQSVSALGALVDDVLDFARLEGGQLRVHREAVDVRELLHDAVELLATQADARGLALWAHCGRTVPQTLVTDGTRLRQVLYKLVSNAVKFTDQGGIRLSAHALRGGRRGPMLALTVRDTGMGMTAEAQAGLFEAFAQGDPSTTRRHGGAGLGLAISAEITALLGGHIRVRSQPGVGSTFAVCLPWPEDDRAPPPLACSAAGARIWVVAPSPSLLRDLSALCVEAGLRCEPLSALPDSAMLVRGAESGLAAVLADDDALRLAAISRGTWGERLAHYGLGGVLMTGLSVASESVPRSLVPLYKPARPARLVEALAAAVAMRQPRPTRAPRPGTAVLATPARSQPASTRTRPLALLAEDNPVNQLIATALLERCGFQVVVAGNGHEACSLFAHHRRAVAFSVVLMDCHMPGMDGFDATRALRQVEAADGGPRTPVIAISADTEAHASGKCRAAGMDDFLPKPVSLDRLATTLRRWLGGAGLAMP